MSVQKVVLCPFYSRARPSGVTLESAGLENIPQVPGNRAEVGQNYAHGDFDQLRLNFPKVGGYFPLPGSKKQIPDGFGLQ